MKDDRGLPNGYGFDTPLPGVAMRLCAHRLSEHGSYQENRPKRPPCNPKPPCPVSHVPTLPASSRRRHRHKGCGPTIQTP